MKQLALSLALLLSTTADAIILPILPSFEPWISCEFMLTNPQDSGPAIQRFNEMAKLRPHIMTFHNEHASDKAMAAFGLTKLKGLSLHLQNLNGLTKVLIKDGKKVVSSLMVHFPPVFVWKDVKQGEFDYVELDLTLQKEEARNLGFGSVYEGGKARKFVAFTLGRHSDDVKLWVGIDVPYDDHAEYSPAFPHAILAPDDVLLSRIDLLSTWLK